MLHNIILPPELWNWTASPIPLVASVVFAFVVMGGVSMWTLKPRSVGDHRTPRERALDEIRAIEATHHLALNDPKTHCARISNTLRAYLTYGCNIPAKTTTTAQLAQTLKQKNVPVHFAAQIIHILSVSDAAQSPTARADMDAIKTLSNITEQIILLYPPHSQIRRDRQN